MNMSPEAIAARERYYEEKRKRKKVTVAGVTDNDVIIALHRNAGNITDAADFLGMDRGSLRIRVNSSEKLKSIKDSIVETFVDETESELKKLVKAGNPSAIIFVLKTLGKNRGYVEKTVTEHELGPYAAKNAANMIEAMRKAALQATDLPLPPPRMIGVQEEEEEIDDANWRVEETVDVSGGLQSVESG